jgi:hypothetical protein
LTYKLALEKRKAENQWFKCPIPEAKKKKKNAAVPGGHTCNFNYSGGNQRSGVASVDKKIPETPSQLIKSWVQWYMPVIPATR